MGVCNAKNSVDEESVSKKKSKTLKEVKGEEKKKDGAIKKFENDLTSLDNEKVENREVVLKKKSPVKQEKESKIALELVKEQKLKEKTENNDIVKEKMENFEEISVSGILNEESKIEGLPDIVDGENDEKKEGVEDPDFDQESEADLIDKIPSAEPQTLKENQIDDQPTKNAEIDYSKKKKNKKPKFLVILTEEEEEEPHEIEQVLDFFHQKISEKDENESIIESHHNIGLAFKKAGCHEKAIEHYDRALELKRNRNSEELEKSLESFDKAVEIDPSNAITHFNRGVTNTKIGCSFLDFSESSDESYKNTKSKHFKDAIRDYTEAIRLYHGFIEAIYNRSMLHLLAFEDSRKCIDDLIIVTNELYKTIIEQRNKNEENVMRKEDTSKFLQFHVHENISSVNDRIVKHCNLIRTKNEPNSNIEEVQNLLLIRSLLKSLLGDHTNACKDFKVASRLQNELPGVRNHFQTQILNTFLTNEENKNNNVDNMNKGEKKDQGQEIEEDIVIFDRSSLLLTRKKENQHDVGVSSVYPYGLSDPTNEIFLLIERHLGHNRIYCDSQLLFNSKKFEDLEIYHKLNFTSMIFGSTDEQYQSFEYLVRIKDDEEHVISNSTKSFRMNVLVNHGYGEEELMEILSDSKKIQEKNIYGIGNNMKSYHPGVDITPIYSFIGKIENYEKLEKFPHEEIDEESKTLISVFSSYENGKCLRQLVQEREKVMEKSFSELEFLIIIREILRSICFLFEHNRVHRNISMDTVFLDDDFGRLVIGCFGDSLHLTDHKSLRFLPDRYFNKGSKPAVLAPEVMSCPLDGETWIDYSKNDVFSVGLIGHRILSRGRGEAFVGNKRKQSMYQDISVSFSKVVREFVKGMLFVDPGERYGCHKALEECHEIIKTRIK